MIPLSLYIHFPWCVQKCPYCDFNSHKQKENILEQDLDQKNYIDALIKDVELILPYVWGRRISSIFIGGGTPSLLKPSQLESLLSQIRARLQILPNAEITLEANPGSADQANFNAYRQLGINRLSIGVQSFNNQHLKTLGRIHQADEAKNAFEMARNAGFEQINLDIMFGLPNQTIAEGLQDLEQAIALNPNHISYYQLSLEPNTYFHRYPPILPHDELIEELQIQGQALLHNAAYKQYEVSAFAQAKSECLHNRNYWEFGDYIGIGAGAHGKITMSNEQKVYRTSLKKHPTSYLKLAGTMDCFDEFKCVDAKELPFEFMLNVLRLKNGVPKQYFQERCFLDLASLDLNLKKLESRGLLQTHNTHLCATNRGFLFLNQAISEFIA